MTHRIDFDVVVDVFPRLGVKAGLGQANIVGAVDSSGPANVLKRPRLQLGDAWNNDATQQNHFAAGNRRSVIGRSIGREAHKVGKAVSPAVWPRFRVGVANGVRGINNIERVDEIVLRLTWLNWLTEIGMQHDIE